MKIALLTDGIYPYVIGGMQKHSFYLAKYFAQQHVYVDLYHTNKSDLDIEKLDCFTENEKKFIKNFVIDFPSANKLPGHYIRASYRYSEKIVELFKQNNSAIDFVYAKGFTAWKLIQEKQKGFECPPIGINFHGYEMFQKTPDLKSFLAQKLLLRKPVLYNIKYADYLFSYGGKITEIIKTLISNPIKIIELPTGIESRWLNTNNTNVRKPLKFIFVGRYERRKGINELNTVLKNLIKKYSFEFNFIGPIPLNKQLKSAQIHYWGSISNADKIKELLSQNDILVCPSYSEGMPNAIVEAMACGLGIIASNVGAVNQLVDVDNGILINPGNKLELKEAIKQMIQMNTTELKKLKKRSIEKVEQRFLWDTLILETIEKIKKII